MCCGAATVRKPRNPTSALQAAFLYVHELCCQLEDVGVLKMAIAGARRAIDGTKRRAASGLLWRQLATDLTCCSF
jgi:hypothetical protein